MAAKELKEMGVWLEAIKCKWCRDPFVVVCQESPVDKKPCAPAVFGAAPVADTYICRTCGVYFSVVYADGHARMQRDTTMPKPHRAPWTFNMEQNCKEHLWMQHLQAQLDALGWIERMEKKGAARASAVEGKIDGVSRFMQVVQKYQAETLKELGIALKWEAFHERVAVWYRTRQGMTASDLTNEPPSDGEDDDEWRINSSDEEEE